MVVYTKILLLFNLIYLTSSSPLQSDPCLFATCPQGSICSRSIDGQSYNCIKEYAFSPRSNFKSLTSRSRDLVTNVPVNYYEKYMTMSPCMSSPCGHREICRNLPNNQYVCQSEMESYADTKQAAAAYKSKMQTDPWTNLQKIFKSHQAYRRVTPLKAMKKPREEDYVDLSTEEIRNQLGNVCEDIEVGKKIKNPLRASQYIICLKNKYHIRNCPLGLVFNTFSEGCEKSRNIPNDYLKKSNPCKNKSIFVPTGKFQYKCECPPGFTGKHCEKEDICQPTFCGNNGVCLSIGYENEVSHMCWCNNGLEIGLSCEDSNTLDTNPCLDLNSHKFSHALSLNPSLYVQCGEGNKPLIKTCQFPLVFNQELQECDWE